MTRGPLVYPCGGLVRGAVGGLSRWVRYCGPETATRRRGLPYKLGELPILFPAELVRVTRARGYEAQA